MQVKVKYTGPRGTYRHGDVLMVPGDVILVPKAEAKDLVANGPYQKVAPPKSKKRTSRRGE